MSEGRLRDAAAKGDVSCTPVHGGQGQQGNCRRGSRGRGPRGCSGDCGPAARGGRGAGRGAAGQRGRRGQGGVLMAPPAVAVRPPPRDLPRQERVCKLCNAGAVEDLQHSTLECPVITRGRQRYQLFNPPSADLSSVMNHPDQAAVASAVQAMLRHRTHTLETIPALLRS
jgi:hypothetical protein